MWSNDDGYMWSNDDEEDEEDEDDGLWCFASANDVCGPTRITGSMLMKHERVCKTNFPGEGGESSSRWTGRLWTSNFHEADFQPPHPHLRHHRYWVDSPSPRNHTRKVLPPLHRDNHCGLDKVQLSTLALQNRTTFLICVLVLVWQSSAYSSIAKPGKHFLIETDDAAEDQKDYEGRPN